MMWLGHARRTVWAAALGAFLAAGPLGPVALLHTGLDDPACQATENAAQGPRAEAADSTPRPGHCAVCHWLQSLRSASPATGDVAQAPGGTGETLEPQRSTPVVLPPVASPGRSPPPPAV